MVNRGAEQPEERRTAMKASSYHNDKEGSQESARRASQWPAGLRATSGIKRAFSCQEGEVKEGAQQSSGGADQSSPESAEWSLVVRALVIRRVSSRQESDMYPRGRR